MKHIVFLLSFFLIFCAATAADTTSQGAFGKKFYVCFPKNNDTNFTANGAHASLHLYIAAKGEAQASGTVSYELNGRQSIPFLTEKNKTVDIEIPIEMETLSYAEPEKKAILIESNEDVVVYGLSKADYTSDAFVAYPVSALDTMYIVCAYQNDIVYIGSDQNKFAGFVAVGTEDSTEVFIESPVVLNSPKTTKPFEKTSFMLSKGETRMVVTSRLSSKIDITGTIVTSTKKIAVFSFHELTAMPRSNGNATRNCLLEQAPPLAFLGNHYLLTPHNSWQKGLPTLARIVAYFDSTILFLPTGLKQLNRGQFYEIDSITPMEIKSNKPILCAQYESSPKPSRDTTIKVNGDPFMVFLPPVQQFQNEYTFISAPFPTFNFHWVSVVIPTCCISTVEVDAVSVPDTTFRAIPTTDFSFGYIPLAPGSHHIRADTTFEILAYGYGNADSYGYCGGQDTKRLLELIMDTSPPSTSSAIRCDSAFITFYEDSLYDSGIDIVGIVASQNVRTTVPQPQGGARRTEIQGTLIDPLADGAVSFTATDRKGLTLTGTVPMKGFTIGAKLPDLSKPEIVHTVSIHDVMVKNSGKFSQTFTPSLRTNIAVSVPQQWASITLQPGDSIAIPLWVEAKYFPLVIDTLILTDDCSRKQFIPLEIHTIPEILYSDSRCNVPLQLRPSSLSATVQGDVLNIRSDSTWEITIYSVLGTVIREYKGTNNAQIHRDDLASGVYLFECTAGATVFRFSQYW